MMVDTVWILLLGLALYYPMTHSRRLHCCDSNDFESVTRRTLVSVLATETCERHSLLLLSDGSLWAAMVFKDMKELSSSSWGIGVFNIPAYSFHTNLTLPLLYQYIGHAQKFVSVQYCITVVVVSDNPAFLAAFTESSFKSHLLLIQSTRLIMFTHLPLHRLITLNHIHKTLSRTNSLIAVVQQNSTTLRVKSVNVYSMIPYSEPASQLLVATWTPDRGFITKYPTPLFADKFAKFTHRPHLKVTTEQFPTQKLIEVDDPSQPGGKRVIVIGGMDNVMQLLSQRMNFTYSYMRPHDRKWGSKFVNGTYVGGMLGLVMSKEVELALGPFGFLWKRYKYMDYTHYLSHITYKIFSARSRPKVDPWGFLLPLSPFVWLALLTTMLLVIIAMLILPSCLPTFVHYNNRRDTNIFNCVRVLLREDIQETIGWWWWERGVLGIWMMMMLVMTQSYSGNLMSLLAVRYIINPYHDLRDVLDSDVRIILNDNNLNTEYYKTADTGVFRELGDLLDTKRVVYKELNEFPSSMNTLVRSGTHIIFDVDTHFWNMMGADFSRNGRCDFYVAPSNYFVYAVAMITHKNSPLTPAISRVAECLVESRLFDRWVWYSQPNTSSCINTPNIITVNAVLSLNNLWGMFVILGVGFAIAFVIFLLEIACVYTKNVISQDGTLVT